MVVACDGVLFTATAFCVASEFDEDKPFSGVALDEGRGDEGEVGVVIVEWVEGLSELYLDVADEDTVDVTELDRDTDGSESDEPEETLDVLGEEAVDVTDLAGAD